MFSAHTHTHTKIQLYIINILSIIFMCFTRRVLLCTLSWNTYITWQHQNDETQSACMHKFTHLHKHIIYIWFKFESYIQTWDHRLICSTAWASLEKLNSILNELEYLHVLKGLGGYYKVKCGSGIKCIIICVRASRSFIKNNNSVTQWNDQMMPWKHRETQSDSIM